MNLLYKSTRDAEKTVTASQAILKGLADDGGLFVPVSIPKLPVSLGELKEMTYQEIAYTVMKEFLTDFTEEELKSCIAKAYVSLIPKRLHRLRRWRMLIIWNCSTEQRSHSKIWHFPFFRTF